MGKEGPERSKYSHESENIIKIKKEVTFQKAKDTAKSCQEFQKTADLTGVHLM